MQGRNAADIRIAFIASAAFFASVSLTRAQSDLPQFSNPYGGATDYVQSEQAPADAKAAQAPAHRPTTKSAKKTSAHRAATTAQKRAPASAAPSEAFTQDASALPPAASAKPASPDAGSDNPLSFGMKWNAQNNPTFSSGTSTIPAVNEIKRNANDDPVETGTGIQAGVNLKF